MYTSIMFLIINLYTNIWININSRQISCLDNMDHNLPFSHFVFITFISTQTRLKELNFLRKYKRFFQTSFVIILNYYVLLSIFLFHQQLQLLYQPLLLIESLHHYLNLYQHHLHYQQFFDEVFS